VVVRQEAPADYPTLRTHRIGVGLYDLRGDRLVRRDLLELDVTGERTEIPALAGVPAADVLLLNDDDLSYTKLRLDERSMATVVNHIAGIESSLARALVWNAAWDMLRDAELAARDYVTLVCAGLPAEKDINLVTATLRQAQAALIMYGDPAWAPTGWRQLADAAVTALAAAEPGSGFQLAWARAFAAAGRSSTDMATLRGWLDGVDVPEGLRVEADLRWEILQSLVALGGAGPEEIEAELDSDRTATGEREAALARALVPTAESKAETWRRLVGDRALPNWLQRSMLQGFQHSAQVELTRPYAAEFFAAVGDVWAQRDGDPAQEFAQLGYPSQQVSDDTVRLTDQWLADNADQPAPLRRLIAEGRDGVQRALRARARDAAATR